MSELVFYHNPQSRAATINFGLVFDLLPDLPEFKAYAERMTARPAFAKVRGS